MCLLICSRCRCVHLRFSIFRLRFSHRFPITCPLTANRTHTPTNYTGKWSLSAASQRQWCVLMLNCVFHFPICMGMESTTCEIKFLDHFASNISQLLNSRRFPCISESRTMHWQCPIRPKHEHIINRNQRKNFVCVCVYANWRAQPMCGLVIQWTIRFVRATEILSQWF